MHPRKPRAAAKPAVRSAKPKPRTASKTKPRTSAGTPGGARTAGKRKPPSRRSR